MSHTRAIIPVVNFWFLHSVSAQPINRYTVNNLGTLAGQSSSIARGINNAGQVVGRSGNPANAGTRAFLWTGSQLRALGVLTGGE